MKRKFSLLHIARNGKECVYLLHIKNKFNDCWKVGITRDLNVRLKYYPGSFDITVVDTFWRDTNEARTLEKYIHDNCTEKYRWKARRFSGYSETYKEIVDIRAWYKKMVADGI